MKIVKCEDIKAGLGLEQSESADPALALASGECGYGQGNAAISQTPAGQAL